MGHTVARRGCSAPVRRWWGHVDVLVLWRRAIASPDLPARGHQVLVGTWVWSSSCGWGQPVTFMMPTPVSGLHRPCLGMKCFSKPCYDSISPIPPGPWGLWGWQEGEPQIPTEPRVAAGVDIDRGCSSYSLRKPRQMREGRGSP